MTTHPRTTKMHNEISTPFGLDTRSIWEREYDAAKKAYPKDGPECWEWYANGAVADASNGFASVAGHGSEH